MTSSNNGTSGPAVTKSFDYIWMLENSSPQYRTMCPSISSPQFQDKEKTTAWRLRMLLDNTPTPQKFFLESDARVETDLRVIFKVYVNGTDEINMFKIGRPHNFKRSESCCAEWAGESSMAKAFDKMVEGNSLFILCKIDILDNNFTSSCFYLSADLSKAFDSGKFSDVTLVADGQEFQAHKVILAARSSVFAAMFEHQMDENISSRVVITDIEPDVLREILNFVYTNNSPNMKEMAKELFIAADKYALFQLMLMCEDAVGCDMSIDTAAEILAFADHVNAPNLMVHAIEFINLNGLEVIRTGGWKNLIKSHAHLVADTYEALLTQMSKKK